MFNLIFALSELLFASASAIIGIGDKTAEDVKSEFKELFDGTTLKDRIYLSIAFVFFISCPFLIIIAVHYMSD